MISLSRGAKIAGGVALATATMLLYGRATRTNDTPSEVTAHHDRLQQRLQELQSARRAPGADPGDPIAARGALQAAPRPTLAPRAAGGAVPGRPQKMPGTASEGEANIIDPDDIPGLKRMALENPDPEERLAAVVMLGASEDPQAPAILAKALSDDNEDVRMAALESLSDFTDEPPVDAIESALSDPSAEIRFEALSVLADVAGDRARSAIERALRDPDEDVRALAESLLSEEGPEPEDPRPNG